MTEPLTYCKVCAGWVRKCSLKIINSNFLISTLNKALGFWIQLLTTATKKVWSEMSTLFCERLCLSAQQHTLIAIERLGKTSPCYLKQKQGALMEGMWFHDDKVHCSTTHNTHATVAFFICFHIGDELKIDLSATCTARKIRVRKIGFQMYLC